MTGTEGLVQIDDIRSSDEFYFTIGAWSGAWDWSKVYTESFPYEFFIGAPDTIDDEFPEPSAEESEPSSESDLLGGFFEEDGKQGCSSVAASNGFFFLMGLLGLSRRRRV